MRGDLARLLLYSLLIKLHKSLEHNDMENELRSTIKLKEKRKFLSRILRAKVILPSNFKSGIDRDLLLVQQQRRLDICLKDLAKQIQQHELNIKEMRKSIRGKPKIKTFHIRQKWKQKYIGKFSFLFKKQKQEIVNLSEIEKKTERNKKDYKRYKNRKRIKNEKKLHEQIIRADSIILNKSHFNLNVSHKLLLIKGLNFVPTPKWNNKMEDKEWFNLMRHIRAVEWESCFPDNNSDSNLNCLPKKLKISKFNRPKKEEVDEKTKVYCAMIETKLRNVKPQIVSNYYRRNNLDSMLKEALHELTILVRNRKIVVCRSDKDGKIVILNYNDYNKIMEQELSKFNIIEHLNVNNITKHFENKRTKANSLIIKLHEENCINDHLLKHTIGMKFENNKYSKITGAIAKNFVCNQAAYAYPLFKTHKLSNHLLKDVSIFDIPTRLLQSAGNITTSRITSFLEMFLNPISISYCKYEINEYCKDSKTYLEDVEKWKNTQKITKLDKLFLVAADVQSLYPNIPRKVVEEGVKDALKISTNYSDSVINTITTLTMFCLENVVVQNGEKFYNQSQGIITGDNDSVSLANIALHYIIRPIAKTLNLAVLFRRYIDDIMWFSVSEELTNKIKQQISTTFKNNGLNLIFRSINTDDTNSSLEFLDVDHIICQNTKGGFYTKNYIKPTALERVFLNGLSHHPRSVFKSIIFSESIRLRRLCERDQDYHSGIEQLRIKCLKSCFNENLVKQMIDITKSWKERFSPPMSSNKKSNNTRLVWATHFPDFLKLSKKEKNLNHKALVAYKRPTTLSGFLTNYKTLAHNSSDICSGSVSCKRCKLCGANGNRKMTNETTVIKSQSGKIFRLHKRLTCKDFGIYVANCRICSAQYVGQTVTSFSTRWNTHRSVWNSGNVEENDRAALKVHYAKQHPDCVNIDLAEAYSVTFIDQPNNPKDLDMAESAWIGKLRAMVNINRTVLPLIR